MEKLSALEAFVMHMCLYMSFYAGVCIQSVFCSVLCVIWIMSMHGDHHLYSGIVVHFLRLILFLNFFFFPQLLVISLYQF